MLFSHTLLLQVVLTGIVNKSGRVTIGAFAPPSNAFRIEHSRSIHEHQQNDVRHSFHTHYYIKERKETLGYINISPKKRFDQIADSNQILDKLCILTIDNVRYNLTAWGKSAFILDSHSLTQEQNGNSVDTVI